MWNIEKAREVYSLAHWSNGYFDVGDAGSQLGHLIVRPGGDTNTPGIDLHALCNEIQQAGLALPVLVRFTDILHDRVNKLNAAFATAIQSCRYEGRYTSVYPIKVNQQQRVVHELLSCNQKEDGPHVGLEAGSKPELMAILALSNPNNGTIVCNGYKDSEYIRLALIGQQMGHRIYIVLEKLTELELVLKEAQEMGIKPCLGLRVRLASIGEGNWQNSGGEKSKFGLSAAQILHVVNRLRENNMLDCLRLLHCHMGSQLANIRDIQRGVRECARYYSEMHKLGVNIRCVDVGGGLGIDYEGTRSRNFCSMNYSLQEYADNIVKVLQDTCVSQNLPHPDIITESGRALTAHHAVLITEVIAVEQTTSPASATKPDADDPEVVHNLWHNLKQLGENNPRTAMENYHETVHSLAETQSQYVKGELTLAQKAHAEKLYVEICNKVRGQLNPGNRSHRETLDELNDKLADKYFCNFSLFQSLPDVWAIDQIFPIVPLNRLDEEPDRRGTLQDITCDSDGRIDFYVDSEGIESSLTLHEKRPGESYCLGIFLTGAYQEILGDMHNLFGDTNSVNVCLDKQHGHRLEQAQQGDTVDNVLRYVHFNPDTLMESYRHQIAQTTLDGKRRSSYLEELKAGLHGYTYLED